MMSLQSRGIYTMSQKNVPPLACYNFETREWMLIFFGRNITDKVSSEKTLYCATSNNLCFCTTGKCGNMKIAFFTQMQEFNQSLLDFFNLFKSRLILTLLYDSLNLVINAFSSRLKEMPRVLQQLDCTACTVHQCAVFWVSSFPR